MSANTFTSSLRGKSKLPDTGPKEPIGGKKAQLPSFKKASLPSGGTGSVAKAGVVPNGKLSLSAGTISSAKTSTDKIAEVVSEPISDTQQSSGLSDIPTAVTSSGEPSAPAVVPISVAPATAQRPAHPSGTKQVSLIPSLSRVSAPQSGVSPGLAGRSSTGRVSSSLGTKPLTNESAKPASTAASVPSSQITSEKSTSAAAIVSDSVSTYAVSKEFGEVEPGGESMKVNTLRDTVAELSETVEPEANFDTSSFIGNEPTPSASTDETLNPVDSKHIIDPKPQDLVPVPKSTTMIPTLSRVGSAKSGLSQSSLAPTKSTLVSEKTTQGVIPSNGRSMQLPTSSRSSQPKPAVITNATSGRSTPSRLSSSGSIPIVAKAPELGLKSASKAPLPTFRRKSEPESAPQSQGTRSSLGASKVSNISGSRIVAESSIELTPVAVVADPVTVEQGVDISSSGIEDRTVEQIEMVPEDVSDGIVLSMEVEALKSVPTDIATNLVSTVPSGISATTVLSDSNTKKLSPVKPPLSSTLEKKSPVRLSQASTPSTTGRTSIPSSAAKSADSAAKSAVKAPLPTFKRKSISSSPDVKRVDGVQAIKSGSNSLSSSTRQLDSNNIVNTALEPTDSGVLSIKESSEIDLTLLSALAEEEFVDASESRSIVALNSLGVDSSSVLRVPSKEKPAQLIPDRTAVTVGEFGFSQSESTYLTPNPIEPSHEIKLANPGIVGEAQHTAVVEKQTLPEENSSTPIAQAKVASPLSRQSSKAFVATEVLSTASVKSSPGNPAISKTSKATPLRSNSLSSQIKTTKTPDSASRVSIKAPLPSFRRKSDSVPAKPGTAVADTVSDKDDLTVSTSSHSAIDSQVVANAVSPLVSHSDNPLSYQEDDVKGTSVMDVLTLPGSPRSNSESASNTQLSPKTSIPPGSAGDIGRVLDFDEDTTKELEVLSQSTALELRKSSQDEFKDTRPETPGTSRNVQRKLATPTFRRKSDSELATDSNSAQQTPGKLISKAATPSFKRKSMGDVSEGATLSLDNEVSSKSKMFSFDDDVVSIRSIDSATQSFTAKTQHIQNAGSSVSTPDSKVAITTAKLYVGENNIKFGLPQSLIVVRGPNAPKQEISPRINPQKRSTKSPAAKVGTSSAPVPVLRLPSKSPITTAKSPTNIARGKSPAPDRLPDRSPISPVPQLPNVLELHGALEKLEISMDDHEADMSSLSSVNTSPRLNTPSERAADIERMRQLSAKEAGLWALRLKEENLRREQSRLKDLASKEVAAAAIKAREDAEKVLIERIRSLAHKELTAIANKRSETAERLTQEKLRKVAAQEVAAAATRAREMAEKNAQTRLRSLVLTDLPAAAHEIGKSAQLRKLASLEVAAGTVKAREDGGRVVEESLTQRFFEEAEIASARSKEQLDRETQDVLQKMVAREVAAATGIARENTEKELQERLRRLANSEFDDALAEAAFYKDVGEEDAVFQRAKHLSSKEVTAATFHAREVADKQNAELLRKLATEEVSQIASKFSMDMERKSRTLLQRVASKEVMIGASEAREIAEKATQDSLRKLASKEMAALQLKSKEEMEQRLRESSSSSASRRDSKLPPLKRRQSPRSPSSTPTRIASDGDELDFEFIDDGKILSEPVTPISALLAGSSPSLSTPIETPTECRTPITAEYEEHLSFSGVVETKEYPPLEIPAGQEIVSNPQSPSHSPLLQKSLSLVEAAVVTQAIDSRESAVSSTAGLGDDTGGKINLYETELALYCASEVLPSQTQSSKSSLIERPESIDLNREVESCISSLSESSPGERKPRVSFGEPIYYESPQTLPDEPPRTGSARLATSKKPTLGIQRSSSTSAIPGRSKIAGSSDPKGIPPPKPSVPKVAVKLSAANSSLGIASPEKSVARSRPVLTSSVSSSSMALPKGNVSSSRKSFPLSKISSPAISPSLSPATRAQTKAPLPSFKKPVSKFTNAAISSGALTQSSVTILAADQEVPPGVETYCDAVINPQGATVLDSSEADEPSVVLLEAETSLSVASERTSVIGTGEAESVAESNYAGGISSSASSATSSISSIGKMSLLPMPGTILRASSDTKPASGESKILVGEYCDNSDTASNSSLIPRKPTSPRPIVAITTDSSPRNLRPGAIQVSPKPALPRFGFSSNSKGESPNHSSPKTVSSVSPKTTSHSPKTTSHSPKTTSQSPKNTQSKTLSGKTSSSTPSLTDKHDEAGPRKAATPKFGSVKEDQGESPDRGKSKRVLDIKTDLSDAVAISLAPTPLATPSTTPSSAGRKVPKFSSPKVSSGKDVASKLPPWGGRVPPKESKPALTQSSLLSRSGVAGNNNSNQSLVSTSSASTIPDASLRKRPVSPYATTNTGTFGAPGSPGRSTPVHLRRSSNASPALSEKSMSMMSDDADSPSKSVPRTLKGRRNSKTAIDIEIAAVVQENTIPANEIPSETATEDRLPSRLQFSRADSNNMSNMSLPDQYDVNIRKVNSKCRCYYPECVRVLGNSTANCMCFECNVVACPKHSRDVHDSFDDNKPEESSHVTHYCLHCYGKKYGIEDIPSLIRDSVRGSEVDNDSSDDEFVDDSQVVAIATDMLDRINILDANSMGALPKIIEQPNESDGEASAQSKTPSVGSSSNILAASSGPSVSYAGRPSEAAAVAALNHAGSTAMEAFILQWATKHPKGPGSGIGDSGSTPPLTVTPAGMTPTMTLTPTSSSILQVSPSGYMHTDTTLLSVDEILPSQTPSDTGLQNDSIKLGLMAKSLTPAQLREWDKKYCIVRPDADGSLDPNAFQDYQQYRIYSNGAIPIQAMIRGYLYRRNKHPSQCRSNLGNVTNLKSPDVQSSSLPAQGVSKLFSFRVSDLVTEWDRKYSPSHLTSVEFEGYSRNATKIQACMRGHRTRLTLDPVSMLNARRQEEWKRKYAVRDPLVATFTEYQSYRTYFNASIVIQSLLRGNHIRSTCREAKILRAGQFYKVLNSVIADFNSVQDPTSLPFDEYQGFKIYSNAAIAIQSIIRGHIAREHPFGYLPFKLPPSPRASIEQSPNPKPSSSLLPLSLARSLTKGATFYLKNEEDSDDEDEREIATSVDIGSGATQRAFSLPCSLTVMSLYGATRGRHYDPEAANNSSNNSNSSSRLNSRRMASGRQTSEFSDADESELIDGNDDQFWDCFESDADSDASLEEITDVDKEKLMADELKKIEEIMAFNFEMSLQNEREVEFGGEIIEDTATFSDDDEDTGDGSTTLKDDDEFDLSATFSGSNRPLQGANNASENGGKVKTLAKTRSAIERDRARGLSRTDSKIFRKGAATNATNQTSNNNTGSKDGKRVAFSSDVGLAAIHEHDNDEEDEDDGVNGQKSSSETVPTMNPQAFSNEPLQTEMIVSFSDDSFDKFSQTLCNVEVSKEIEAVQKLELQIDSTRDTDVATSTEPLCGEDEGQANANGLATDPSEDDVTVTGSLAMNPRTDNCTLSNNDELQEHQVKEPAEEVFRADGEDDVVSETGSDVDGYYADRKSGQRDDPLEDLRRSVLARRGQESAEFAEEYAPVDNSHIDVPPELQYENEPDEDDVEEKMSTFLENQSLAASSTVSQNRGCINAVAELIFTNAWISQLSLPPDDEDFATSRDSKARQRSHQEGPARGRKGIKAANDRESSDSATDILVGQSPLSCGAFLNTMMLSPERVCDRDDEGDEGENMGDEHSDGDPESSDKKWYNVIWSPPSARFSL